MHDAPRMATDGDNLFALPKSGSPRSFNDNRIYFICGSRRDRPNGPVTDLVTLLRDHTTDQLHDALIVGSCAVRYTLAARFGFQIFPEQPINCSKSNKPPALDLATFAPDVPFIEQAVERRSSSAVAIVATGRSVISSQGLARNRTAQFSIECRDIEIETDRPAHERLGDDETGQ